jgi:hypothetical protein
MRNTILNKSLFNTANKKLDDVYNIVINSSRQSPEIEQILQKIDELQNEIEEVK